MYYFLKGGYMKKNGTFLFLIVSSPMLFLSIFCICGLITGMSFGMNQQNEKMQSLRDFLCRYVNEIGKERQEKETEHVKNKQCAMSQKELLSFMCEIYKPEGERDLSKFSQFYKKNQNDVICTDSENQEGFILIDRYSLKDGKAKKSQKKDY